MLAVEKYLLKTWYSRVTNSITLYQVTTLSHSFGLHQGGREGISFHEKPESLTKIWNSRRLSSAVLHTVTHFRLYQERASRHSTTPWHASRGRQSGRGRPGTSWPGRAGGRKEGGQGGRGGGGAAATW